jgi:hypothetical protein
MNVWNVATARHANNDSKLLATGLQSRSVKAISKTHLPVRLVRAIGISTLQPEPLRLPNTAIEPIEWNALSGWGADDHAAAFATFLTSCRPLLRASVREGDKRPMYLALGLRTPKKKGRQGGL